MIRDFCALGPACLRTGPISFIVFWKIHRPWKLFRGLNEATQILEMKPAFIYFCRGRICSEFSREKKQWFASRWKVARMIASSWCLTIPLIGQCLTPNSTLSVRRFAIFSELNFSAGFSADTDASLGEKYKFRPSELLARSMVDEVF